ncbi:hypothetical protein Slin14017_G111040 [Septoria linicola]|nr:hypothetical protein Slin14017_G111040 [Septoria linicola]
MALRTESSFASFAAAGVEGSPMSPRGPPSSVGASELGRLALGRPGSRDSDMGVTTRSGVKREAASRGESSRGSAGAKKGKEKASGSSSALPRKSGRTSKTTAAQPDPDDEDDSDDGSDDHDEDDEDDTTQTREVNPLQKAMALYLIHDPSNSSFSEFMAPTLPGRSEASANFRALAVASSRLVRSDADLALLNAACPLEGPQWSRQITRNMQNRWHHILSAYRSYYASHGKEAQGVDVTDTIDSIKSLFKAIQDTLLIFRNLENGAPQRLVDILLEVLETVPAFSVDTRPAGAQPYAGGSQQFEYNLLLRFTAFQSNWLSCLEVIRVLSAAGYVERFVHRESRWKQSYVKLYNVLAQTKPPSPGDSNDMLRGLYHRLMAMGIKMTE